MKKGLYIIIKEQGVEALVIKTDGSRSYKDINYTAENHYYLKLVVLKNKLLKVREKEDKLYFTLPDYNKPITFINNKSQEVEVHYNSNKYKISEGEKISTESK